jgi:hypothetical protein
MEERGKSDCRTPLFLVGNSSLIHIRKVEVGDVLWVLLNILEGH